MCYNWFPIRSRSANGLKNYFIPCGYCVECRNATRSQWSVRLALELQACHVQGWRSAFFTLTYDDDNMPHLPAVCLGSENGWLDHTVIDHETGEISPYSDIPCFYKPHVKNFVLAIRKWLHRNYGITSVKYLIACDIGKNTHRSHYHGIISYPVGAKKLNTRYADKSAPEVFDSQALHAKIKELWHYGYVFPRHHLGGRDSHGYNHKPFEISGDIVNASFYAAKYCAKSVVFYDLIKGVVDKDSDYKDFDCFHVQSKSLGLSYIKDMTFEQKKKLLSVGVQFVGKDKVYPVPLYFKNKILFNPRYIIRSDGSRLVDREVTEFFEKNYESIFEEKVKFYADLARDCLDHEYQHARGVPDVDNTNDYLAFLKSKSGLTFDGLAREYLARYGVKNFSVYKGLSHADQWFLRYYPKHFDCLPVDYSHIGHEHEDWPMRFWSALLSTLGTNTGIDEPWEEELERVKDYHVSLNEKEVARCLEPDRICEAV